MVTEVRHTSITVSNMQRALSFYRDLLGLKVVLDRTQGGEFLDMLTGLTGVRMRVAMLEAPDGHRIELFQFLSHESSQTEAPGLTDLGCSHVAFSIDDLEELYTRMQRAGIAFTCPPALSPDGYAKVTYCRDYDGTILELVQVIDSKRSPYQGATHSSKASSSA